MELAAALALGLILGAGGAHWVRRGEIVYLRKEAAQATDRLVHAWREDPTTVIPPRDPEPVVVEILTLELQEEVDQWDDPEVRAETEASIRGMLAKNMGTPAILKTFEKGG